MGTTTVTPAALREEVRTWLEAHWPAGRERSRRAWLDEVVDAFPGWASPGSSTVKALANKYFSRGLRLIELRKDQLSLLPYVMGKISENPLKFIIFIDDLAFSKSDDNFSMLKAALEGSASATADNAVIYATSNRRHIVKESFGDREGDDVHRNDTLQETLSLSERFGLVVTYSKPNKALYLTIVKKLAEKFGVRLDEKELEIKAEAFALKKGNRSARCAEQFINSLL
jgi:predicted AAA+ superfamily ATPase